MTNLGNLQEVQGLQASMRILETPQGKEVMKFLEEICGWYDFAEADPNLILIKHGKRQVLATLKTLLEQKAEVIVALTKE